MKIIAEIGSNWCKHKDRGGLDKETARSQIMLAKEFGATGVKFQLFTAKELFGPKVIGTSFQRCFDDYALPVSWLPFLREECDRVDIEFLCSAFSVEGFELVDECVDTHKLASPERTDPGLVNWLLDQPKPFYYSDGCLSDKLPSGIPMSCTSLYPATIDQYAFYPPGQEWGLSDHTKGATAALIALDHGATHFEKHVDFLPAVGSPGPDSRVSSSPDEWAVFINAIRNYDPERHMKLKARCSEMYARQEGHGGWYRPLPENVNLLPDHPPIVGGKL